MIRLLRNRSKRNDGHFRSVPKIANFDDSRAVFSFPEILANHPLVQIELRYGQQISLKIREPVANVNLGNTWCEMCVHSFELQAFSWFLLSKL